MYSSDANEILSSENSDDVCGKLLKCYESEVVSDDNMCSQMLRCDTSTWRFKFLYNNGFDDYIEEYAYHFNETSGAFYSSYVKLQNSNGKLTVLTQVDSIFQGYGYVTAQNDSISCSVVSYNIFDNVKYECQQNLTLYGNYSSFRWGDDIGVENSSSIML